MQLPPPPPPPPLLDDEELLEDEELLDDELELLDEEPPDEELPPVDDELPPISVSVLELELGYCTVKSGHPLVSLNLFSPKHLSIKPSPTPVSSSLEFTILSYSSSDKVTISPLPHAAKTAKTAAAAKSAKQTCFSLINNLTYLNSPANQYRKFRACGRGL
jgi:hypothetical protein